MNGNNTYQDRQTVANTGEILFEQYCKDKNVFFTRFGFDEKNKSLPFFYGINPLVRNLPDYYVASKTRGFFVMVKGTANIKKKEVDMIPQFLEWYSTKEVSLYYAFCFKDQPVIFKTPHQIIELYEQSEDKKWPDGVVYRNLNVQK